MNPVFQLSGCLALFLGLVFGSGVPIVASSRLTAPEKLCVGAAAGVVALYLFAICDYWLDLPRAAVVVPIIAALALLLIRRRESWAVLCDPDARRLLGAYLIIAAWTLGFLALVRSYSGGGWALDWIDHYSRAQLFLHHHPAHSALYGGDSLPTRPPLANAATSAFLQVTGGDFAYFQIFTSLLNSLVFLPMWLFAGRLGRGAARAQAVLTVLYLCNPSILENSTFAWTKLITAFFVLIGLFLFLPAPDGFSRRRLSAAFLCLGAAVLTHYSAGPYVVALAVAYLWWRRAELRQARFWRDTVLCALPAAILLVTWFAWSLHVFGPAGTFFSNTSVTDTTARSVGSFTRENSINLVNTVVPHPLRKMNPALIDQQSRLGHFRDYFFQIYQVNLLFMFGCAGGPALLFLLWRRWHRPAPAGPFPRTFWLWFVGCTVVLGAAAYGGIDQWGVAHLCLQGLLGLGLAFLAAQFDDLPRWGRIFVCLGLTADFILGIAIHFHLQNHFFSPIAFLENSGQRVLEFHSTATWVNLSVKIHHGYEFVGDWPIARPLLIGLLVCLFTLAIARLCRELAPGRPSVSG